MKRLTLATLALLGLAVAAVPSQGGLLHRRGCDSGCGAPCDVGPCAVAWEEREVTCYRVETRTRNVEREVRRPVTKEVEVPYTWTELVSVSTPEKRTVQYCETITKEVPYTYMACVPVVTPEKRTVMTCKIVTKEVPYTYTVCIPVVTPEKRKVITYNCITEQVPCQVAVCRTVPCEVVDPCTGCCYTVCRRVTEMQTVMKSVVALDPG